MAKKSSKSTKQSGGKGSDDQAAKSKQPDDAKPAVEQSQPMQVSPEAMAKMAEMSASLPGLMAYAHTAGGAPVVPTEEGMIKNKALQAMEEQTQGTLKILADFMQVAMKHAQALQERTRQSFDIYDAKISFTPQIGHHYFLYRKANGQRVMSMVGPDEWGGSGTCPLGTCQAEVKLLADHTWEMINTYEGYSPDEEEADK